MGVKKTDIYDLDRALARLVDRAAHRLFRELDLWLVYLFGLAALFYIALIIEIWRQLT